MFKKLLLGLALIAGTAWGMDSNSRGSPEKNPLGLDAPSRSFKEVYAEGFLVGLQKAQMFAQMLKTIEEKQNQIINEVVSTDGIPYGKGLINIQKAYSPIINKLNELLAISNASNFEVVSHLLKENLANMHEMLLSTEKSYLTYLGKMETLSNHKKLIEQYYNMRHQTHDNRPWDDEFIFYVDLNPDKLQDAFDQKLKEVSNLYSSEMAKGLYNNCIRPIITGFKYINNVNFHNLATNLPNLSLIY